jgi:hypothetical protein
MRTRVPRRMWRGALVALVAIALGASSTAEASDAGRAAGSQQQDPAATARPITPGSARAEQSTAATAGDVSALAATGLTYSTVDPCRIFDTRWTGAGTVGAGRPYVGYDLRFQGVCGIPDDGSAKAVMVNVIAVITRGTGYVRATDYPFDPNSGATVLNFNDGLISSNGIPIPMCDSSTQVCDWDLGFTVNTGSSHIVFDVLGYFS